MLSQNTQDSIQQSLFATVSMKVNPTMAAGAAARPGNFRQAPQMVAKPILAGNLNGQSIKQTILNGAPASVSRGNMTVSMSM